MTLTTTHRCARAAALIAALAVTPRIAAAQSSSAQGWNAIFAQLATLTQNVMIQLNNVIANHGSGLTTVAPLSAASVASLTTVAPMTTQLKQAYGYRIQSVEQQTAIHDVEAQLPAQVAQLQKLIASSGSAAQVAGTAQQIAKELNALRVSLGLPAITLPMIPGTPTAPAAPGSSNAGQGGYGNPRSSGSPVCHEVDRKAVAEVKSQIDSVKSRNPVDATKLRELEKKQHFLEHPANARNCKFG